MREVGREHDALDVDVVTQLDRDALDVLQAERDVPAHVVARPPRQPLDVQQALRPVAVALVPVVGLLHPERYPAEARLGEEDSEVRQAIEDAGHDQLREADGGRDVQERQRDPLHDFARPELLEDLRIGARVLERRLRRARAQAIEGDVHRQRHPHVDRGRPEPVVLGQRIRPAVREHAEVDAAVLELGHGVVEVRPRDDAQPDEAVTRDRAVFLGQPVVVRADGRAVHVVVGQRAPEPRADLHVGEDHLREQTIHVLLAQALLRRADARRALHRGAEWLPRLVRPPGPEIEERRWIRRLALDENRVAAVGKLDRPRRALAILRGHARRPALWQDLQVTVAREQGRKRGCCHAGRSFASRRRECTIGPA